MPTTPELGNDLLIKGELVIDTTNGTAEFKDWRGQVILRVTHLPHPIPPNIMIDVTAIRNVTSYTLISMQEDAPPLGDEPDERCPVCTRIHTSGEYTKWGPYTFVQSHEYIVWTRNSQQTYAHRGRMQFLGGGASSFKYQLAFNARGPNRSTRNQFAGTQTLDARNIVKVEEVDVDPAKRYVDEIDRDMKRDDK